MFYSWSPFFVPKIRSLSSFFNCLVQFCILFLPGVSLSALWALRAHGRWRGTPVTFHGQGKFFWSGSGRNLVTFNTICIPIECIKSPERRSSLKWTIRKLEFPIKALCSRPLEVSVHRISYHWSQIWGLGDLEFITMIHEPLAYFYGFAAWKDNWNQRHCFSRGRIARIYFIARFWH